MSYKWEGEKIAQLRLKSRHNTLNENEQLLYLDYLQSLALADSEATMDDAAYVSKINEKSAFTRGVVSLALIAVIWLFSATGCKLVEMPYLIPFSTYELSYKLTGEYLNIDNLASSAREHGYLPLDKGGRLSSLYEVKSISTDCLFDVITEGLHDPADGKTMRDYVFYDTDFMRKAGRFLREHLSRLTGETSTVSTSSAPQSVTTDTDAGGGEKWVNS